MGNLKGNRLVDDEPAASELITPVESQEPSFLRRTQEQCIISKSLTTLHNKNEDVPSFYGILFTVVAQADVDILSFELDVRLDKTENDLDIEVYTLPGEFRTVGDNLAYRNDESLWTLVAQTKGSVVITPQGEALAIPPQDFTPVSMVKNERISFYVTMKGPYLDSVVDALMKTGEDHRQGDDLKLLVGAGLSEYKFPAEVDGIVDPQFAGTIHYEKKGACNELVATAPIEYNFLFSEEPLRDVNDLISDIVDGYMANSAILRHYADKYNLQKSGSAVTEQKDYSGGCPAGWARCTSSYWKTTIKLTHSEALEFSDVAYEMYKPVDYITTELSKELGRANAYYLGLKSVTADFDITLFGPKVTSSMDAVQQDFFEETLVDFLSYEIDPVQATYFDVQVTGQALTGGRRQRRLQGSGVKLSGKVTAARYAYLSAEDFDNLLADALRAKQALFLDLLGQGGTKPGSISQDNRYTYFENLGDLSSAFVLTENTDKAVPTSTTGGSSGSGSLDMGLVIGAAAGGVVVLLLLVFLCCYCYVRRRRARYKRQVDEDERRNSDNKTQDDSYDRKDENEFDVREEGASDASEDMVDLEKEDVVNDVPVVAAAAVAKDMPEQARALPQRTKSNEKMEGLGTFMEKQPRDDPNVMSSSRSVGFTRKVPGRSKSDDGINLGGFIDRNKGAPGNRMSGAASVGPGVISGRPPPPARTLSREEARLMMIPGPPSGKKLSCKDADLPSTNDPEPVRGLQKSNSFDEKPKQRAPPGRSKSFDLQRPQEITESAIQRDKKGLGQRLNAFLDGQPVDKKDKMSSSATVGHAPTRTQSANAGSSSTSLSNFMEAQPRQTDKNAASGARSVGPGLDVSSSHSIRKGRKKTAAEKSSANAGTSLEGFMASQPESEKVSSGAKSLDGGRSLPKRSKSSDDAVALRGFMEQEAKSKSSKSKTSGAQSVSPEMLAGGEKKKKKRSKSFDGDSSKAPRKMDAI